MSSPGFRRSLAGSSRKPPRFAPTDPRNGRVALKICDLVQWYGAAGSGGIRTYVDRKAEDAAARPGVTHVLVRPGPLTRRTESRGRVIYEIEGRLMAAGSPYRWFGRPDLIGRILAREAPDVIEFDSPYHLPWQAFRQRRRRPCAVAGYFHADVSVAYVEAPLRRLGMGPLAPPARALAEAYVRAVHSRCDVTLTASPALRERLRRLGVARTELAPLGVDLELFRPAPLDAALRRTLGCPPGGSLLVYAGRFVHEKRVDVLADMVELLPDRLRPRLLLIGDGPLGAEMRRRAVVSDRLEVRPFLDDRAALARVLAAADVYVTAGPHETFGLSVAEAMACGTPVAGVDSGALRDRIAPGTGLLVPPGRPADFAAAVCRLLDEGAGAAGRRARLFAERTSSWSACFESLHAAYATALERRRRAAALAGRSIAPEPAAAGCRERLQP